MSVNGGFLSESHRALVEAMNTLYNSAGRPALRKVSREVTAKRPEEGVSHECFRWMLSGERLPKWAKWEPVVRHLSAVAGERLDVDGEVRRFQVLWYSAYADDARPSPGAASAGAADAESVSVLRSRQETVAEEQLARERAAEEALGRAYAAAHEEAQRIHAAARAEAAEIVARARAEAEAVRSFPARGVGPGREDLSHCLAGLAALALFGALVGVMVGALDHGILAPTVKTQWYGFVCVVTGPVVGLFAGAAIGGMAGTGLERLLADDDVLLTFVACGGLVGLAVSVVTVQGPSSGLWLPVLAAGAGCVFGGAAGLIVSGGRLVGRDREAVTDRREELLD
ncbi:hypothetical protein [Streptomyces sp. NPDC001480]|uniref:hypothetical protein n=1 Tax=Streptomyces sp. NPDC001480 TaxID=3364577 RepID=UPI0036BC0C65